ncbi:MAG: D-alanyl-D-alanine carboxypeptidase [Thermoflavifilum sp.]|nr:D-alanyl-D-alanine carboxypeptidase [Thermoflavifilum sp.]
MLWGIMLSSCSPTHRIQRFTRQWMRDTVFQGAQVGVSVYDFQRQRFVVDDQGDHYFQPASNTKLFSLFAGLHLLGDSTTGVLYSRRNDTTWIAGTGDPSLFHPDFSQQRARDWLIHDTSRCLVLASTVNHNPIWGPGWAWNDYAEDYQPERSALPLYGNVVWCVVEKDSLQMIPHYFQKIGVVEWVNDDRLAPAISRSMEENLFVVHPVEVRVHIQIPYRVFSGSVTAELLADTLHKPVILELSKSLKCDSSGVYEIPNVPVDSLFRFMMHRSDNFYAEQTLMMCSFRLWNTLDTRRVIGYVLDSLLPDLPQRPRWVDGSGLSRLNLFTPNDMVYILRRLITDFPRQRIFSLLPTGGAGTLSRYPDLRGKLYGKTGSLSNQAALSGYLITHRGKLLIFSILAGNYVSSPAALREAMGNWLRRLVKLY